MSSYSYDLSEEEEKNKIKTQPKEMNRTPSLNFLPNIKTRHKIKAKSKTDELSQKIAERLDKLNEKSNSKLNISIGKTNMDGIKIDWKQKRIDFFARKHLLKKEDEQLKLIAKSRNSLREEVNQKISDKNEKTSKCTLF